MTSAALSQLGFTPSSGGSSAPAGSSLNGLGFVPTIGSTGNGGTPTSAPTDPGNVYAEDKNGSASSGLASMSNAVGTVFPAGKVLGQDIGTLGGFGLTKAGDLLNGTNNSKYYDLSAPSPLQAAGAGASSILTGAAGGVPEGVASLIPGLEAAAPLGANLSQGAGALSALGRVGVQAGIGAGMGATNALATTGKPGQIFNGALTGAAVSGGLASAGELGSALVESLASNSASSRLTSQANRLKTLQNAVADSKTDPIETITHLDSKLSVVDGKVNTEGIENELEDLQGSVNNQAKAVVAAIPGTVPTDSFQADVEHAVKSNPQIRDSGKVAQALAQVKSRFADYSSSFGDDMTYAQINGVRTAMNRTYDPESMDVERAIGNVARGYIYSAGDSGGAAQTLMQQSGQLSDAQNFAEKLRGTAVKGGRLGKYFADLIGSEVGGAMGSVGGAIGTGIGAVAGGIAADKALGAFQSSYFNPPLAAPAKAISDLTSSPAAKSAAAYGKGALLGAFSPTPAQ